MEISLQRLYRIMNGLGFAESTIGTKYIREAVEIAADLDRVMMTKHIYPAIAKAHGEAPMAVERAIRTAISKATRSPMWEWAWREIGGWNEPTNSEVIMRLTREVQLDEDGVSD